MKPLQVAYSPDADDAFMFWALETGRLTTSLKFDFQQLDTESLNQAILNGQFDISAVSIGVLPRILSTYRLLPHGGSVGQNYGPVVVAKNRDFQDNWQEHVVAIPGENTTAALTLRLLHPGIKTVEVPITPFEEAFNCLDDERAQASVIIHEGRLTYENNGCFLLEDIGKAWFEKTHLPLPLGGNVIRRSLDESLQHDINQLLGNSIREALNHREEAIEWLLTQNLGNLKTTEEIDQYLKLYANEDTASYSEQVKKSIQEILMQGQSAGFFSETVPGDVMEDSFWRSMTSSSG